MLSKHIKKVIIATSVALVMGTSFILPHPLIMDPITVEAAVVNSQSGNLTVTASSLWSYGSANWSDRTRTYSKGTKLTVIQKHTVDGREMYKLSNGNYISANPRYVSFKATGSNPSVAPSQKSSMKTTENLNMRRGAGTNHGIILTIPKGKEVKVISISGDWANVDYNGKVGYASAKYLTKSNSSNPTPTPPSVETPSSNVNKKTTENLNMRTGAGTTHSRILTIPKGSKVIVLSESNGWSKLNYNGKIGYASSDYLQAIATAPVNPTPTPKPPVVETPTSNVNKKTTVNLNMRTGAGTNHGRILTIPKGATVIVLSENAGWAKLNYNGKVGYASLDYLQALANTPVKPAPTPTPKPPVVETPSSSDERKTTENLNLRTGAGTTNQRILTIPKNSSVLVLSETNGWAKINYGGKIGYVSSSYLKKVAVTAPVPKPEPTPEPTPTPEPKPEPTPEEIPTEGTDMRMITGNLYLRTAADGNSNVITILEKGTVVEVESLTGKWAKITYEGQVGYASTKFMKQIDDTIMPDPETPVETPEETPEETLDIRENTLNLNLRKGPGTNHDILVTMPKGSILTVTEIVGQWGKVSYGGYTGYASLDYMKKVYDPSSGGAADSDAHGKMDGMNVVNYSNVDITVSGLANIDSGVKSVRVYLNSKIQGSASYGLKRSDDSNQNTGYRYVIKRNNLFPGENQILVVVSGNNGEKLTYTKTIQVNKVPVIVVDAGHGGKDSGASGVLNGLKLREKTYALEFAMAFNEALKSSGFKTVMTRSDDRFIELSNRARIGNNNHADLFFSFHHDYSSNANSKGAFVIYPSYKTSSISESTISESRDVAGYVKNAMMEMGFNDRRNGTDKSICGHTLAVLRQTQTKSILAEFGYMSNAEDLSKITDPVFQKAMAYSLTKQLKEYFRMN